MKKPRSYRWNRAADPVPSDKTNRFQGEMNAVRIWDTALIPEEIENIFESEKSLYSVK